MIHIKRLNENKLWHEINQEEFDEIQYIGDRFTKIETTKIKKIIRSIDNTIFQEKPTYTIDFICAEFLVKTKLYNASKLIRIAFYKRIDDYIYVHLHMEKSIKNNPVHSNQIFSCDTIDGVESLFENLKSKGIFILR
jgi:hypothetical protein